MAEPVTILDCAWRTDEWYAARIGRLTGSVAPDAFAEPTKAGGERACVTELRTRLAVEQVTGISAEDRYQSRDMERGVALEPEARAAYAARTGQVVRTTGFLRHDTLMTGCSLDGHIGADMHGLIEIKCPRMTQHFSYWRAGTVPAEYRFQLIHALWLTDAEWIDFVSYDPRFPGALRLFIVRLRRAEVNLQSYALMVRMFLVSVEKDMREVQALMTRQAA